jgi:hypothetical protein
MPGIATAPLTAQQIRRRLLLVDGEGSGIEADINMARRPRYLSPVHDPFGGLAAAPLNPDAVRCRAIFGV